MKSERVKKARMLIPIDAVKMYASPEMVSNPVGSGA